MIEQLRIRGLGVIAEADLELSGGLVAVTGETGAGKTMIMTALDLLFGGRANPSLIRGGAQRAEVEAWLRPDDADGVAQRFDVEFEDGLLVVGRWVGEQRSRAWVGGRGAAASLLAELGDELVVRHGQNDQRRLANARHRRALLDRYAGPEHLAAIAVFGALVAELRDVEAELEGLRTAEKEAGQQAEIWRHGVAEIEAAAPQPGEEEQVRAELQRIEHAVDLREAVAGAHAALRGDDSGGAERAVAAAKEFLQRAGQHDSALSELADALAGAEAVIADSASALASHIDTLDADPERIDALQMRLSVLKGLTRKYGGGIEAVLAWADQASRRLQEVDGSGERQQMLWARRTELLQQLADAGDGLSDGRRDAAIRLQAAVNIELPALALAHSSLAVSVTQSDDPDGTASPDGRMRTARVDGFDNIDLLFVPHPGAPPRPIEQGASGGELSRVMLALEVALAGASPPAVFVFDEVDAGIGGRAAVEVGRRLASLAAKSQVIVVTHLSQVAAFADQHIVVRKQPDGQVTSSSVVSLDGTERRKELARMMAGLDDSASALAHADELIDLAAVERQRRAAVG